MLLSSIIAPLLVHLLYLSEALNVTDEVPKVSGHHVHHHHHYQRNSSIFLVDHALCSACQVFFNHIDVFSLSSLELILEGNKLHENEVNSTVVVLRSLSNQSIVDVGQVLDEFVAARPWWILEGEPYSWFPWIHDVIFHRVPNSIAKHFKAIARKNFLPPQECATSPLQVAGHAFDAWGNRILNLEIEFSNCMFSVFVVYATASNKASDTVGFVEGEVCPSTVNKWDCVFLPTTNCTLPSQISNCVGADEKCMPRAWGSQLFTNATSAGIKLSGTEEEEFKASIIAHAEATDGLKARDCIPQIGFRSKTPITRVDVSSTEEPKKTCNIHAIPYVFTRGFLFRFNAAFRSIINHKVFNFRLSTDPPFLPSEACVSGHIRMHDRAIPNTDMIEYCKNCTGVDENGGMKYICDPMEIGPWYDYGCFSRAPFGVLTLDHFLNASLVLRPRIRNIFLMTDDSVWLDKQLQDYRARSHAPGAMFNIYAFSAGANHRMASSSATVDFWASVKLAQQCEAFVGHFSSASTVLVYNSMCYRHGYSTFLRCPDAYDLGGAQL